MSSTDHTHSGERLPRINVGDTVISEHDGLLGRVIGFDPTDEWPFLVFWSNGIEEACGPNDLSPYDDSLETIALGGSRR